MANVGDRIGDWCLDRFLGKGGQGEVWRASRQKEGEESADVTELAMLIDEKDEDVERVRQIIQSIAAEHGRDAAALKILHSPLDARDADRAEQRMFREIQALKKVEHRNLLRIIDAPENHRWYASELMSGETLESSLAITKGNVEEALRRIRPIVDGVAHLHKCGQVHRDIKPANIFMGRDGRLVLGDFGLVFFTDDKHSRLSGTLENVGSWDWMPGWAENKRIEDLDPTFDVFALAKIIWCMISGEPALHRHYFAEPSNDLTKNEIFSKARYLDDVNNLLSKCVVEFRRDAMLEDANRLLSEIDAILSRIASGFVAFDPRIERRCLVCGEGGYTTLVDDWTQAHSLQNTFGFGSPNAAFRILVCRNCGHTQWFFNSANQKRAGNVPPAWIADED